MERRRQKRVQLRTACELRTDGRSLPAILLDLSEGGLSIRLQEEELEQGTPAVVVLPLPRGEQLMVESLVWHSRRVKPGRDEKNALVVGLVVANPPEAYLELVAQRDRIQPPRSRPATAAPSPAAPTPAPEPPKRIPGTLWRVRLQMSGSPRSRTIQIETEDAEAAAARALEESGLSWIVLEVTEA